MTREDTRVNEAREVARANLPTAWGEFDARAFACPSGFVYLALVKGVVDGAEGVLARLHSECLTGDALGSLRCDCGVQLRSALRTIAAHGNGVLVYATGQEGRGIGLVNKLRAYVEQDDGADTVDANTRLGLPVDSRDYAEAAGVLAALGVGSVRLLTNNPAKVAGLEAAGMTVEGVEALATAPHVRNRHYLETKGRRLGHLRLAGAQLPPVDLTSPDVTALLGPVRPRDHRPYVVLKFAQTVDGRIATGNGESKWISGREERAASHALRAAADAVLVGVGTVLQDDPQLTVRMVAGASPLRVVLDSSLQIPLTARVLADDAATLVVTTEFANTTRAAALTEQGVAVRTARPSPQGIDLVDTLGLLRALGVHCVLVEGGARVITSMLAAGVVDRLVVGLAPTILGQGTDAVGDLGVVSVAEGVRLANRTVHAAGEDLLIGWDIVEPA